MTRIILFITAIVLLLSSCDKDEGCGTVRGGYIDDYGNCKLKVEFYDGDVKYVTVDAKTWIDFEIGSTVCF